MQQFLEFLHRAVRLLGGIANVTRALATFFEAVAALLGGRPFGFAS
jgi:hypothetical protein